MPRNPLLNSRLFDPYRWSKAPQVKCACNDLQLLLGLKDKRYEPYVVMVLLDLYCSWRSDPSQYVSFSRDKNRYGKNSRYASIKVGYVGIVNLTDKLYAEGYIDYVEGITYRDPVTKKIYASYTSKMRATKKLIRLVVRHKVKLSMISRHANESVIKFRTEKDENDVARDIKDFDAPRDVERSAKVLVEYNNLLQKSYIDIDDEMLTADDMKELSRYDKKLKRNIVEYTLDLSKKKVYRVFNNEDWKQGGRIYGAWWHGCPKELRKYIIINGSPVVELDFSSIHVLLLYAHLGDNFLDEDTDAYTIEGHDFRSAMKVVMMSAINAKPSDKADGDTRAIQATWDTLIKKHNQKRKEHGIDSHESLYNMLEAIKERHPRIAKFLASGEGIKLQKEDSDIAVDIINQHTKMNVPILSVHDSFIVPYMFEPFTRDIMNQAYGKFVSRYLGQGYSSTIETIHFDKGVIQGDDTLDNLNVLKLIKPAVEADDRVDIYNRLQAKVTSNQIRRYLKWNKNHYQISKLNKFIFINNTN